MSELQNISKKTDLDKEREKFAFHSEKYWIEIKTGSSKKANSEERTLAKLVEKHEKNGDLLELLTPFLEHDSPALRLSSAARLLKSESREIAISVLHELLENPTLIAATAGAVLRVNGISRNSSFKRNA